MKSTELREKMNKAEEKVSKIERTLNNHIERAERAAVEIAQRGWDLENRYQKYGTEDHNDCYWMIAEYENRTEAVYSSKKKLEEAKRVLENWKEKYEAQLRKESKISGIPSIFRQLLEDLVEQWTQDDVARLAMMYERKKVLSYEEFREEYSYNKEESLKKTEEEFRRANLTAAEYFVMDLYNRVNSVTGEVTDWSGITYSGKALNGVIVGVNGTVSVETIIAGGYNIQRMHYRVLVKKIG